MKSKLAMLEFTCAKTSETLQTEDQEEILRQLKAVKTVMNAVEELRVSKTQEMFDDEKPVENIEKFDGLVRKALSKADKDLKTLSDWFEEKKRLKAEQERKEKLDFEKELQELKLKNKQELEPTSTSTSESQAVVNKANSKLPKIDIEKFCGEKTDWPRFWCQFTENIDGRADLAATNKLSYLHSYLTPKVKSAIAGLPYSEAGYEKAKQVLEKRYGNKEEIVAAFVKQITELPRITTSSPRKVEEFYEKLNVAVNALTTIEKIDSVAGQAALTLEKLGAIKGDLTRTDPNWRSWGYGELLQNLEQWVERNSVTPQTEEFWYKRDHRDTKPRKTFQAQGNPKGCVYCDSQNHRGVNCDQVKDPVERKKVLTRKKLCYNCASGIHSHLTCPSKRSCDTCHARHHSSICTSQPATAMTTVKVSSEGVFPILVVKVNGILTRALVDSGSGTSYISAHLANMLKTKPTRHTSSRVEMMVAVKTVRLQMYEVEVSSLTEDYQTRVEFAKVDKKGPLLTVDNPNYQGIVENHSHLRGVEIIDTDTKPKLPVHLVLGKNIFSRIKKPLKPLLGREDEPVAELTKFGWFVMSPGLELDTRTALLTQTYHEDYQRLCQLDVLGLADRPEHSQQTVHDEFKEQLTRSEEGWYETGLPFIPGHADLPNNEQGSKRRLQSLLPRLNRQNLVQSYDKIIAEQLRDGIIEKAPDTPKGREFYIPHKPVVREAAETTKVRVVYDASARAYPGSPSLNDILYSGPPLQNKLWDVLIQQRGYPSVITGDISKAFLQVRVREEDRDALRFHWRANNDQPVETYRFQRVVFGLTCSPYLLNGVLETHLDTWAQSYPAEVERLRRSLFVDDTILGGHNTKQVRERKEFAVKVMEDAKFQLHKWHSNLPELESPAGKTQDAEVSYAKHEVGTRQGESKLLGVPWDKSGDTIRVELPSEPSPPTKRGVLSQLARIYDPLGVASPIYLQGKVLYREACQQKLGWDQEITGDLLKNWRKWETGLPSSVTFPRCLAPYQEEITDMQLHSFGDASKDGVAAAVYSVATQPSGTTVRLVAAKARLAKQGLTIPRLELVAAHMATNLLVNTRDALQDQPITESYAWSDSTTVLHWLLGQGEYRQFVANRVAKIKSQPDIKWRYVETSENPADLGSRGGQVTKLWREGPEWLPHPDQWPNNPVTASTPASEAEAKAKRTLLNVAQQGPPTEPDTFGEILDKYPLRKALRIQARVRRWNPKDKGPITAEQIRDELVWWIKKAQTQAEAESSHEAIQKSLNLQRSPEGLLECRGRLQGRTPIYIPHRSVLAKKLVQQVHEKTLHGGVGLTMAAVREQYWIPKLRSLVKRVRKACNTCRRHGARPYPAPSPGNLPTSRSTPSVGPFEICGVDYTGPIKYKTGPNEEAKAYILLWACSLTRAVHLELVPNLSAEVFILALKRFIARRGRPRIIYSDNGGAFVHAGDWLKKVQTEEKVCETLEKAEITWRFNLSRAPWWGGQYERLVGVVKSAFYKAVGGGRLTWEELIEVLLDLETQINRRPLGYVEDDIQLPVLTPASFLYTRSTEIPIQPVHQISEADLRKRAKFLRRTKEQLWNRWVKEYLVALRERHNLTHKESDKKPKVGDVVLIKSDAKNKGTWPMGYIESLHPGKDGVVRAVGVRTTNGRLERAPQHLYPLELSCEVPPKPLDPEVNEFEPRPRRKAADTAREAIICTAEYESEEF